jgi:glycosyltransferase involved in cell wall biosynthesis
MTSETGDEALVSIVVVAHNNWPDLELAIESALCQSWPAKEVIVVDNDSTDETCAEVQTRYTGRVRYFRQANTLDGGGYNRGIAEAKGKFIQLLDGDDLLAPNKVAKQMAVFSERPDADLVYGETRQFQGGTGRPSWSDWTTTSHDDMLATLIDPAGEGAGLVPHCVLFRRSVFDRVGKWDETLFGADFDYWLRSAWEGCVFSFSPGAWCFHRRRPSQMSADSVAMVNRTITTLEKALTYVDKEPYRSMLRSRLASLRFAGAVTDLHLERGAALRELRSARSLDRRRISALPFAMGFAVVTIPGMRRAIKNALMSRARRRVAQALGVMD